MTLPYVPDQELAEAHVGVGRYRDRGCSLWPSCLECPFPRCRYDAGGWDVARERDARIREARAAEPWLKRRELAERFGVGVRMVDRALASGK